MGQTLDVHAHFYPPVYIDFLVRQGGASARKADRLRIWYERNRFFAGALSERLALLDRVGIGQQVLSMPGQWVLVEQTQACRDNAAAANDALAGVCRDLPTRFGFFANLPLVDPDAALVELERAAADLGAGGVIVPTHVLGRPLDDARFEPVYAELARRALPLFLHPGPPAHPVAPEGYPSYGLESGLYFPTEDANALMRLVMGGVFDRHPDLRIICPHLGGPIPFLFRRLTLGPEGTERVEACLARPIEDYLRRVLYDTVSMHQPAVCCARDTFGADHLVLGTDFPYVTPEGIEDILATIEGMGLTPEERAGVLGDTARAWITLR